MANHGEFNKFTKKLKGREFYCKTLYDLYWNQLRFGTSKVYLSEEVDEVLKQLKELFDNQEDKIVREKKRAEDSELENYKLKRKKK